MSTIKANYILDAAGGNTATINGAIPAPATSPTLTTPIISGNLGAGGANYGTSGQVLTSGGAGASPSWATPAAGGMTLLGTLTTTSGTSVTLSGLTLTSYKMLIAQINNVSMGGTGTIYLNSFAQITPALTVSTNLLNGIVNIMLDGGVVVSSVSQGSAGAYVGGAASAYYSWDTPINNSATSITFEANSVYDAGSITIYGVK